MYQDNNIVTRHTSNINCRRQDTKASGYHWTNDVLKDSTELSL